MARLRWYGPRSLQPDQKIYVEKKVHREPWTEEPGFKVNSSPKPSIWGRIKLPCLLKKGLALLTCGWASQWAKDGEKRSCATLGS